MRALRISLFALFILMLVVSCSGLDEGGGSGYVIMMPHVSEEGRFRSVVPVDWDSVDGVEFVRRKSQIDATTLFQLSISDMSMEEAKIFAASQLGLDELPERVGTYISPMLHWDLYSLEPPLSEVITIKMLLAMSEDEGDIYIVAMAATAGDFEVEAPYHETIFNSVLHCLKPLE